MPHVLDNPVWNALTSGNSNLANGNNDIKYFSPSVSPFVGFPELNLINWALLDSELTTQRPVAIFADTNVKISHSWQLMKRIDVLQMVYNRSIDFPPFDSKITALKEEDVAQMLELTAMTHPGPFYQHTNRFGFYRGIFDNHRLVAMAGQRMHVAGYTEISAVCTHPDYQGRGYAGELIADQIARMTHAGNIPFLHVVADHKETIHLYQKSGFEERKQFVLYFIQKKV